MFQMVIILDITRTVNVQKILKLVRKQVKQKSEVIEILINLKLYVAYYFQKVRYNKSMWEDLRLAFSTV